MARDERRNQKAAQKRKEREKKIREERARRSAQEMGQGKGGTLAAAAEYPIVECVVSKGWQDRGLAHILITRRMGPGMLLVGGYFVDPWCLGLKDCAAIPGVKDEDYEGNVKKNIFNDPVEFEDCAPEFAKSLILGAVGYAEGLGFRPNRRWEEARRVLGGISDQALDIPMGKDGRPCLVRRAGENWQGPMNRLQRKLGSDGFAMEGEG